MLHMAAHGEPIGGPAGSAATGGARLLRITVAQTYAVAAQLSSVACLPP